MGQYRPEAVGVLHPVLGLIFLRYADKRFTDLTQALPDQGTPADEIDAVDYQAEGVLYLPDAARFGNLLSFTEGANLGRAIALAMQLVEEHNPELKGVLQLGYNLLPNATLVELLRLLASVYLGGDAFGKVYEYFLGNFALKEGQKGGVFFTPTSIVRLIVEILLIAGKLAAMGAVNASRMDLAEKFQALIDEYNAGSQNIEAFFEEPKTFAQALSEEDQRGIAEGLTEEELALFDILTKPEPVLTRAEEAEVI